MPVVNGELKDFNILTVERCVPYLLDKANQFYYFGDLDYEGILIFEKLRDHFYCEPICIRL